jgi:mitochondrial chaperone BCS1
MHDLYKLIFSGQNQFASGGVLLMVIGSVGVFLRSLPTHLWDWIESQATMVITVKDDDAAFTWVKEWFLEQPFLARVRRVDLDTTLRGAQLALIPAPGRHWFWRAGRPVWVTFHRGEEGHGYTRRRSESLTFQTIGRDRAFVKRFIDEILACHHKKLGTSSYLHVYDEGWRHVLAYSPRLLDSVILKAGEKEHLLQDLEKFRASRDRYRRLGVPYHRGYLLYGPPGTGKTSLVSAFAAKCGMSIYAINLTDFTDRTLKSAINDVPENSIILFEDIDCMRAGHRREQAETLSQRLPQSVESSTKPSPQLGVTLSGLLNVLDGFNAPENVVFVMTTNHMEMLDEALLRPGRIDYRLYMGEATDWQRTELYRRFFPEATEAEAGEFAQAHCTETMAEFQGLLLALEQEWERLHSETECSQVF